MVQHMYNVRTYGTYHSKVTVTERPFLYPCVRASEGNFIVTRTVHVCVHRREVEDEVARCVCTEGRWRKGGKVCVHRREMEEGWQGVCAQKGGGGSEGEDGVCPFACTNVSVWRSSSPAFL